MKKEELKNLLRSRNGYLKSGIPKLVSLFNIKYNDAKDAVNEVKEELAMEYIDSKTEVVTSDLMREFLEWQAQKKVAIVAQTPVDVNETPALKDQVGMHIMLGCSHVPFENKIMHSGIKNLIKDYSEQIKGFHLMGDFLDLNSLSSHDKGKFTAIKDLTLDTEYKAGNKLLNEFDEILPKKCWKTYLYGNHEDRYFRWMKVQENAKTPLVSPTQALKLKQRGYQVKESWSQDSFTIGKHLEIFHGIYYNVHSAKKHMDAFRGSCMYVHTHRIQTYIEGNTGSFNIGAGANFDSAAFGYASRGMKSQWQNGFAIVNIDEKGSYYVTQIICQNGKFFFGGKQY